jgi:ubiquinone/menaquinone biosynthesis C-methylase UbiE
VRAWLDQSSRFCEGPLYARLIEPAQTALREVIAREVTPGARVLDAGGGAGALALRLAAHAQEVVGVDRSPAMIAYAEGRRARAGHANVRFVQGDAATALADRPAGASDVASLVLALHELPGAVRGPLLRELCRLAGRVLCLDFAVPLPRNLPGLSNCLLELLAGPTHFRAFRDYGRRGGAPGIARAAGLACEPVRDLHGGSLRLCALRACA